MSPRRPRAHLGPSKDIDRRIPGIGRIRVNSGLPDGPQWRAMNDMVTLLARDADGRALLREVYEDRLKIDVLWSHYRVKSLHLIPLGLAGTPLVAALSEWREGTYKRKECSGDTYRVRKELVDKVRQVKPTGIVADLPDAVRVLRVQMKGARQFNILRSYALAFARDTLGKTSTVYQAIASVTTRPTKRTVKKHPLTPAEVLQIAAAFDTVRAARIASSTAKRGVRPIEATGTDTIVMALTGMNPKEYAGTWIAAADRVRISGTKREGRVRDIPKAFPSALWPHNKLAAPSVGQKNYWRWFREATQVAGIAATPYDLRRTFANWMESAGIPRARRRLFLGHSAADITDLYEQHEVTRYLIEDGAKLRAWINAQLTPGPTPEARPNK